MPGAFDDNYANRQIFLFSEIDQWSAEYVVRQLLAMDRESNEEITIFINSCGGGVRDMFAITDTMKIVKSPIRTVCVGIAASASAVILSSGDTRLVSKTCEIMIHELSAGTFGSMSSMMDNVEQFKKLQKKLVDLLAENTGKTSGQIEESMNRTDKYFNAMEAVSFGLADRIINDQEAQALKLSESITVEGYEIKGKEIQILREGKYIHPVYGDILITEKMLHKMKENFDNNVRGCDISYDYTHDNDSGEAPAALWLRGLEVRQNDDGKGKGLFAKVEFTPMGQKKVSEKEYKYSSADFRIDYIDQHGEHHPYVLCGGTLTNRPFIKNMNPIKLSENYKKEVKSMDRKQLIAELQGHGVDVTALLEEKESLSARVRDLEAKITELNALPAQKESEIKALKDSLSAANEKIVVNEKTATFEGLVAEGKCIPAQKESILNTFKTAEDISEFYKDAPVIVNMSAKGSGDDNNNEDLTDAEAELVNSGEYTREEIIEARKPVTKK
jgi:ATP-dependent Clp protease protease subunit